jgi:hypothetical protein
MTKPLDGVRVLGAASRTFGPAAGVILADRDTETVLAGAGFDRDGIAALRARVALG